MAWVNVEVLGKSALDGGTQRISLRVSTDDAVPRVHETQIDIPPGAASDFFDRNARALLKRLAERDAAKAQADAVPVGAYTPGADPAPDPDQSTLNAFRDAVSKLQAYRHAVEMEIIPATDTDYVTLRAQVQNFVTNRPALKDRLLSLL